MALVSCRPDGQQPSISSKLGIPEKDKPTSPPESLSGLDSEGNPDLQRALDLVELHYGVKEKYSQGPDMGLEAARAEVNKVLHNLKHKR